MSKNRPFTVDHVGSFLRPQSIKEARKKVQEGLLSKEELRAIEDQEIKKISGRPKSSRHQRNYRW